MKVYRPCLKGSGRARVGACADVRGSGVAPVDMDQWLMAAGAYDEFFVACTSMKLFFNTGAKRNTAFMVVLAWLFALA